MMTTATTKTAKLVFGAAALAVSVGVAQLAVGGDLRQSQPEARAELQSAALVTVNRTAKADRASSGAVAPGLTFAVRPIDAAASSYLVRIPVVASSEAPRPAPTRPAQIPSGKPMVACEPVVSMLTDVAKLLQPGRCVT